MISAPYSKLARIYDNVMTHVNYPKWAGYVSSLLKNQNIKIDNIIDITCGTGKHLLNMHLNDMQILGSDFSLEMILEARKNLSGKKVRFITQDVRNIALKEKSVEAVIMLYDSINYLLSEWEVLQVFQEVKRILKKNGIFIFDIVTQEGLRDCFKDYFESDSWGGLAYERHSWYSFKDKIQHNEFLFLYNGKSYKEVHLQKIRTLKKWRTLIAKSNMKLSQEFSNFSKLKANEKSERVHFVCHS